ncbi:hypothetical protein GGX14DRAFT_357924 [Mycena pura]|uniref:Uncharacterized protein n=1 Tax=Mycena pura TaxID=153505 RepID=A0AAD6VN41_9AGAR|nr:hypothetical protein GGX14DRAFT_357924 [Mycena pura]
MSPLFLLLLVLSLHFREILCINCQCVLTHDRISSNCESALTQVAANPDASACLKVSALLGAALQPNASIVGPVDNWLQSLCGVAPCSNATLAAVVTNITTGCSAELSTADSSSAASISTMVQQYYPTARKILCLSDSKTNCITQTLTNIQNILGTLSLNNIVDVIENAAKTNSIPSNVTCSNCVKEAYNIFSQDFPSASSGLKGQLQSECGASMIDGSAPSGVVESAATTSAGAGNSAKGLMLSRDGLAGLTAAGLIAASSLWAALV